MTLTFDLLTSKFEVFILAPKSVDGESLIKLWQQTACIF